MAKSTRKPSGKAFLVGIISPRRRREAAKKKARTPSPAPTPRTKVGTEKEARRKTFVLRVRDECFLQEEPRSHEAEDVAVAAAKSALKVRKRDADAWVLRAENSSDNGWLVDCDLRCLEGHAPGGGRPNEWDAAATARMCEYLTTFPVKGKKKPKEWPSAKRMAESPALRKKWKVPHQTRMHYSRVAIRAGLIYTTRETQALLTKGYKKRRVALCKIWEGKSAAWWKQCVAVQDEGGITKQQTGPTKMWQFKDERITEARVKSGGGKLNFSTFASAHDKAPLVFWSSNMNSQVFVDEVCKKQIYTFLVKNKHISHLLLDGDRSHPGNGGSTLTNKWFNKWLGKNGKLGREITLIGGPDDWKTDGTKRDKKDLKKKRQRQKVSTGEPGAVWCANSPDLNDAEHHVAAVKSRSRIPIGFYKEKELKKLARANWAAYPQESCMKGLERMPKLLKRVKALKGEYLTQKEMRSLT